jgi:hypothetical protein
MWIKEWLAPDELNVSKLYPPGLVEDLPIAL